MPRLRSPDREPEARAELLAEPDGPALPNSDEIELQPAEAPQRQRAQSHGTQVPQHSADDPTLVAMAGEHAAHFVPERLPWQILSRMTRVLQICWFWTGLMALLKETHVYQIDYQQHPGHERRLCAVERVFFEPVEVEWPHGQFFRPQGLACPPDGNGELILESPFGLFAANSSGSSAMRVEELDRVRVPQSTVILCAPHSEAPALQSRLESCLMAAPSPEGLVIWQGRQDQGTQSVVLPWDGPPWRLLAGTILNCAQVKDLLLERHWAGSWCILLAGWDGELLPIAALRLPVGPVRLPPEGTRVSPIFDAPFAIADPAGVAALHVEPRRGRLWAALSDGDLEAWDLLEFSALGRYSSQWPAQVKLRPLALCEDESRGLLVLGRSDGAGPALFRADLPSRPNSEGPPLLAEAVAGARSSNVSNSRQIGMLDGPAI